MIHFNIYNTSYGQKKNQESKCQFDSQQLKFRNRLNYMHVTYCWKTLNKGSNFL